MGEERWRAAFLLSRAASSCLLLVGSVSDRLSDERLLVFSPSDLSCPLAATASLFAVLPISVVLNLAFGWIARPASSSASSCPKLNNVLPCFFVFAFFFFTLLCSSSGAVLLATLSRFFMFAHGSPFGISSTSAPVIWNG